MYRLLPSLLPGLQGRIPCPIRCLRVRVRNVRAHNQCHRDIRSSHRAISAAGMDRLDHHYHCAWFDEYDPRNGLYRKTHWVRSAARLRCRVCRVRWSSFHAPDLVPGRVLSATPMYPIQAPLPVAQNAPSLAFMWFIRSFAAVSISVSFSFKTFC